MIERLIRQEDLLSAIGLEENFENRENNYGEIVTLEDVDRIPKVRGILIPHGVSNREIIKGVFPELEGTLPEEWLNKKYDNFKAPDDMFEIYKDECDVFSTQSFIQLINEGVFSNDNGVGYIHDGYNKLNINVFTLQTEAEILQYPYVLWYNK